MRQAYRALQTILAQIADSNTLREIASVMMIQARTRRQVKVYFCHKCSLDYEDVPFFWIFRDASSRGIPRGTSTATKRLIIRKMGTPLPQRSTSNRSCRPRVKKEAHAA